MVRAYPKNDIRSLEHGNVRRGENGKNYRVVVDIDSVSSGAVERRWWNKVKNSHGSNECCVCLKPSKRSSSTTFGSCTCKRTKLCLECSSRMLRSKNERCPVCRFDGVADDVIKTNGVPCGVETRTGPNGVLEHHIWRYSKKRSGETGMFITKKTSEIPRGKFAPGLHYGMSKEDEKRLVARWARSVKRKVSERD